MKNIIIKEEWIKALEEESVELRDTVMGAIYDYALRGKEPEGLQPVAAVAYRLIKCEIIAMERDLDFDGAREAAIRRKRAMQRRAERQAARNSEEKRQNAGARVITIEKRPIHNARPLPKSGKVPQTHVNDYDHFNSFEEFYDLYPGQKDDIMEEYSRLVWQFGKLNDEMDTLPIALRNHIGWHRTMTERGYRTGQFPTMQRWLTDQSWRDRLPDVEG